MNHANFECNDETVINKATRLCDGVTDCPGAIPPLNRHFIPRLAKLKVHYWPTKIAKTKMYVRHMAENQSRFIKHGERCSMT